MNITVYCGSNPGDNPRFTEAAHALGTWIAQNGHTLVYGGSSVGLMGVVSRAALDAGAEVYPAQRSKEARPSSAWSPRSSSRPAWPSTTSPSLSCARL